MKYWSQLVRNIFSRDGQIQLTIIEKYCMRWAVIHIFSYRSCSRWKSLQNLASFWQQLPKTALSENVHQQTDAETVYTEYMRNWASEVQYFDISIGWWLSKPLIWAWKCVHQWSVEKRPRRVSRNKNVQPMPGRSWTSDLIITPIGPVGPRRRLQSALTLFNEKADEL